MFKGFTKSSVREEQAVIAALNASQAVIEFTPDGYILTANRLYSFDANTPFPRSRQKRR